MISKYGTLCVEMSGSNLTVADVREWLRCIDELGLDDNTPLNMSVLKTTIKTSCVEPVTCGDCVPKVEHTGHTLWFSECALPS